MTGSETKQKARIAADLCFGAAKFAKGEIKPLASRQHQSHE
jgi:hypothetical protein